MSLSGPWKAVPSSNYFASASAYTCRRPPIRLSSTFLRDRSAAAGHDRDVLPTAPAQVRDRHSAAVLREVGDPQHFSRARVQRAEPGVHRGANEYQSARRRDRTAPIRAPVGGHPLRLELLEGAQRHFPGDIAGVDVDRAHLTPRRLLARPAFPSPRNLFRASAAPCPDPGGYTVFDPGRLPSFEMPTSCVDEEQARAGDQMRCLSSFPRRVHPGTSPAASDHIARTGRRYAPPSSSNNSLQYSSCSGVTLVISSGLNVIRASGGGLTGKGRVGQPSSPGVGLSRMTGRSSMPKIGVPVARSKMKSSACFV